MNFDRFAVFETHGEIVDDFTSIGKRTCCVHDAVCFALHRRRENFFAGDVGIELHTAESVFASTKEKSVRNKTNCEICAVRCRIMQRFDAERIEIIVSRFEVGIVIFPCFYGIFAVRSGSVKDSVPKFFNRFAHSLAGENLFCPRFAGNRGNTPLIFVLHFVDIRLQNGISCLACL